MPKYRALVATGSVALIFSIGCRIESGKHGDGEDVKISTPVGGLSVKTNDAVVLQSTGLPAYPGAELIKKDKNNGSADIDLSVGSFQLRVKAVSYHSADSPAQVADFYRRALDRFGDVIQCSHGQPVGTPARTAEGLSCDDENNQKVKVSNDVSGQVELKAGSKSHQHIVEIDPDGSGSKFGLVALDLPRHVTMGSEKDDTRQ